MKAVRIDQPGKLVIAEAPDPEIRNPGDVLVRITSGSICGSDVGIYKGTNSLATYPRIIGHEYGGRVAAVGSRVTHLKAGDLVALDPVRACGHCYACQKGRPNICRSVEVTGVHRDGGFASHIVVPADRAHKVNPKSIPADLVCLVEPYSIGVQVNHRARIAKGDKVLVMGSGPIGLCVMQDAKSRGALVMMTDILEPRLEEAENMGADRTVNVANEDLAKAVEEFSDGEGMHVVVDAVCSLKSFPQAMDLASQGGRVIELGLLSAPSEVPQVNFTKKELDVMGSRLNNHRFPEVIESWENGYYTPDRLRTHTFHYTDAQKAFDLILGQPEVVRKVTLNFD